MTADSQGNAEYFPEKHLAQWFRDQGKEVPVYCFHRVGPKPVTAAYDVLVRELQTDTVVLVDGGTDSLLRGDENALGTPIEDMTSIAAVDALDAALVPRKMLVCLGFGIDAFHGVCHEAIRETGPNPDRTRARRRLGKTRAVVSSRTPSPWSRGCGTGRPRHHRPRGR